MLDEVIMKKEHLITGVVIIVVWWAIAISINNDVLIPTPLNVVDSLVKISTNLNSYVATYKTILRVFEGYFISLLLALIISVFANRIPLIRSLFEPVQSLAKAIPNISYIIITLIWLGSEGSVSVICCLVLFPVFYNNFQFTLDSEPQELKDIEKIYPEEFIKTVKLRTLPLLFDNILSTSKTTLGLGLKIVVMAEILGQVKVGIGKQLHIARLYLNTADLFAWTIIIILVSVIIDSIFDYLIKIKEEK